MTSSQSRAAAAPFPGEGDAAGDTPHVAAYSEEAISMLQERMASAVVDVLSGRRPQHLADPEMWAHRRTVPCTA
jgi:hypothetical protein